MDNQLKNFCWGIAAGTLLVLLLAFGFFMNMQAHQHRVACERQGGEVIADKCVNSNVIITVYP